MDKAHFTMSMGAGLVFIMTKHVYTQKTPNNYLHEYVTNCVFRVLCETYDTIHATQGLVLLRTCTNIFYFPSSVGIIL